MRKYFSKLYLSGKTAFEKEIHKDLINENKKFIITANPETFMIGQRDLEFDKILSSTYTTIVPDGIGIVKAAKLLGYNVKERITGVELADYLLKSANSNRKSVYLFGAKEQVVQLLVEKIKREYPRIEILGYANGYENEKDKIMEHIIDKDPDIVLVALGIPQQEKLIWRYYLKAKKGIFIGVGGSFDVLSGTKKRAPQIFIKLNLEWLYRIMREPSRIKRFIKNNVLFLMSIIQDWRKK